MAVDPGDLKRVCQTQKSLLHGAVNSLTFFVHAVIIKWFHD